MSRKRAFMRAGVKGKSKGRDRLERCGPYASLQTPVSDVRAHPFDSAAFRTAPIRRRRGPGLVATRAIGGNRRAFDDDLVGVRSPVIVSGIAVDVLARIAVGLIPLGLDLIRRVHMGLRLKFGLPVIANGTPTAQTAGQNGDYPIRIDQAGLPGGTVLPAWSYES
jgi:hypothetical protein